ncbi:hypothetical protein HYS54_04585 [Candidatus Micrarchaeota archaeon]|nr:hypothetical protein [Candidatus Micrarchaeota archaeon]
MVSNIAEVVHERWIKPSDNPLAWDFIMTAGLYLFAELANGKIKERLRQEFWQAAVLSAQDIADYVISQPKRDN